LKRKFTGGDGDGTASPNPATVVELDETLTVVARSAASKPTPNKANAVEMSNSSCGGGGGGGGIANSAHDTLRLRQGRWVGDLIAYFLSEDNRRSQQPPPKGDNFFLVGRKDKEAPIITVPRTGHFEEKELTEDDIASAKASKERALSIPLMSLAFQALELHMESIGRTVTTICMGPSTYRTFAPNLDSLNEEEGRKNFELFSAEMRDDWEKFFSSPSAVGVWLVEISPHLFVTVVVNGTSYTLFEFVKRSTKNAAKTAAAAAIAIKNISM
jgi:hypothetical protein